jgi:hypothetical protein
VPTTDYFYPDPDAESTSVDGATQCYNRNLTWADLKAITTSDSADPSRAAYGAAGIRCSTTNNQFKELLRSFFLFDTSGLDNSATISAAVLSIKGSDVATQKYALGGSVVIVASAPASNTDLVKGDFDSVSFDAFSDTITFQTLADTNYHNWTLNAAGIAAISLTGITKLATIAEEDRANSAPAWSSDAGSIYVCCFADTANTTSDPKLAVTYTTGTAYTQSCSATGAFVATIAKTPKPSRTATTACVATWARSTMTFHRTFSVATSCVATKARYVRLNLLGIATGRGYVVCTPVATISKGVKLSRSTATVCVASVAKLVKAVRSAATACAATAAETYHAAGGMYTKSLDAVMACVATCTRIVRRAITPSTIVATETALPVYTVSETAIPAYTVSETTLPVYTVSEVLLDVESA